MFFVTTVRLTVVYSYSALNFVQFFWNTVVARNSLMGGGQKRGPGTYANFQLRRWGHAPMPPGYNTEAHHDLVLQM